MLEWRLNCKTVGDLCARTRLDVETAWGCGVATFQDIMRVLARHGLTLAAETPHATTQQETP